jgi:plasmid maintenance system antidote protein VapI
MRIISSMNALSKHLQARRITQTAFAIEVDTTPATISRICAGVFPPSLDLAVRIDRATDGAVPVASWVTSKDEEVGQ